MPDKPAIEIRRVYDPPDDADGLRVLVDRLWPRGLSKDEAQIDLWAKSLAPSHELRKWFAHKPERFSEFTTRYSSELDERAEHASEFLRQVGDKRVTLLFAARDAACNHALVLRDFLKKTASRR